MRISDKNLLIVCGLCLLFTLAGGLGGYSLKARMVEKNKAKASVTNIVAKPENVSDASYPPPNQNPTQTSSNTATENYYDGHQKTIKNLIKSIHAIAQQQGIQFDLDLQARTEAEFLTFIDRSPHLIQPLLDVYEYFPDSETKDLLRSLLVTTGSDQIQRRAIEYLSSGEPEFRSDWLVLLRDTGVNTAKARDDLFNIIPTLGRPEAIRNAILAITPQIVSSDERFAVINQLNSYLNHTEELVRSAAIETFSQWADNSHAHVIEQALTDSSENVRYTAILAAYSSGIRSNYIESSLLNLMNNPNEDLQMRIHAYNALSNYSLQGQNYDQYYQFHRQLLSSENSGEAKG